MRNVCIGTVVVAKLSRQRLGAMPRNRGTCETTPASGVRTLQVPVLPTAGHALQDRRPATGPALHWVRPITGTMQVTLNEE